MTLVMTSGPAVEPVSVAEAKAHLRIDGSAEDVLLASLVLTSRLHVEAALSLALITQSWRLVLDRWPRRGKAELALGPVQSITSIKVKDAAGVLQTLPATNYLVDIASRPARVVLKDGARIDPGIAAGGIEVDFVAGFGADASSVPAPLRHAILMLTAHWYEHRDPVEIGSSAARIPDAVSDLIQPFRTIRL